ncbi:MAG: M23 family metallopeptidase [Candidatus Caldatribacteriota bacterium]|nr:M23 family metallopeptidase [Candidatus Caldatribacteriota bacterium]
MSKKRYYYFSNHLFSSLKEKRKKRAKLLIIGVGALLLLGAVICFNFSTLTSQKQTKDILSEPSISKETLKSETREEVDNLDKLTEEISVEGEVENEVIKGIEKKIAVTEVTPIEEMVAEEKIKEEKEKKEEEEGITIDGYLQAGDTLYESLMKEGISAAEILDLQEKLKSVVDCNYLPIGCKYSLRYNPEGILTEFVYESSPIDVFHISISDSGVEDLKVVKEDIDKKIVQLEGTIETSLYESMLECADSPQLALQIAEIFAWQIDFLTECREGDTFKILVEKKQKGDFYRWGKVIAAQYKGELLSIHTAILFEDPSGHIDYYDEEGNSLKKAFLRAPLNYKYISSYFSKNRFHPILRIWRPHLAIDYAAPTGTPISTIGGGTVLFAGWKSGYGNYIKIRHPNNYITGYGHLSRYAKGLKKGQKVEQGEIIGYVGATGLATGPHLDFSISKNGKRVDFLKLDLPSASSVNSQYLSQFKETKEKLLDSLENIVELELTVEGK